MRYAVVIENAGSNFSAYVPDLPGCVATGATLVETEAAIREAIGFHLRVAGGWVAHPAAIEQGRICRGCRLTTRWSGRVRDRVSSSNVGVRAAQLKR
jgi:predicted RNase H-like HicB family nuclease